MATHHSGNRLIGTSIRREEDPLLITGKGCYVDDIDLPGMLYLAVLRSPYAHAKIISIDVSKAKDMRESKPRSRRPISTRSLNMAGLLG
jgi:CO/xanthine dehydrogenase Mo-binding subunit